MKRSVLIFIFAFAGMMILFGTGKTFAQDRTNSSNKKNRTDVNTGTTGTSNGNTSGSSTSGSVGLTNSTLKGVGSSPQPKIDDKEGGNGGGTIKPSSLRIYVVSVCWNDNNLTQDCLNESIHEASTRLSKILLEEYAKGVMTSILKVTFSGSTPILERLNVLRKIELQAIAIVQAQILVDIKQLQAFKWDTPVQKQEKLDAVTKKANNAKAEADRGSNWSQYYDEGDISTHTFHTSEAYNQLIHISNFGWTNQ